MAFMPQINNLLLGASVDALMENFANNSILDHFIVNLQMDSRRFAQQ